MHRGYIKLWRSSQDNPMYFAEPFTKWQAWVDLLLLANHKGNTVDVRGIDVVLKPGQILAGEQYLAERWRWSRGKVRRFTGTLKTRQQIEQQKSNVCTVLTILNWKDYQANGTTNDTPNSTTERQQKDTPKNVKNEENEKKHIDGGSISSDSKQQPEGLDNQKNGGVEPPRIMLEFDGGKICIAPAFDELWKHYPKKKAKATALKAFERLVKKKTITNLDAIIEAINNQKESNDWKKDGGQYIPLASTWLNGERWEDELDTTPTAEEFLEQMGGISELKD